METKIATQTPTLLRGSHRSTLWDTRTQTETVIFSGYETPELKPYTDRVKDKGKGKISLSQYIRHHRKAPIFNIHEINETRKALISLFKTHTIPEINTLKLYPEHPETFTLRIGNCTAQRKQFAYRIRAKIKVRRIKHLEKAPLTLNNLKFKAKFQYSISFKCALCSEHQTMRIRNHKAKRSTPICKAHNQIMYIRKVTKKRTPNKRTISIPKIIYEVDH